MLHAENAYLFRHVITRDAAYQMQLPSERAVVHSMAFHLIEAASGGRAPAVALRDSDDFLDFEPHSTDAVSAELAEHARLAGDLPDAYGLYLRRAGKHLESIFEHNAAYNIWLEASNVAEGSELIDVLRTLAKLHMQRREYKKEEALLLRCLELARGIKHRWYEASTTGALATVYNALGKFILSEETFMKALTLASSLGSTRLDRLIRINLANLYRFTKRHDLAINAFSVSINKAEELGDEAAYEYSGALRMLASCYAEAGKLELAEQTFLLHIVAAEENGFHNDRSNSLAKLSNIFWKTSRPILADNTFQEAIALARESCGMYTLAIVLASYSDFLVDTDKDNLAIAYVDEAFALFLECGHFEYAGYSRCRSAVALIKLGLFEKASDNWNQGCQIFLANHSAERLHKTLSEINSACSKSGFPPFELLQA
ncbi:MAG: tetratricopeptide repeat protein [Planctomycetes bacterium]|nr:tetratricopeptide repeat protein [Planctomycetota bacterium]